MCGVNIKHFPGKSFDVRFVIIMVVVFGSALFVVGSLLGWFSHRIHVRRNQLFNALGM